MQEEKNDTTTEKNKGWEDLLADICDEERKEKAARLDILEAEEQERVLIPTQKSKPVVLITGPPSPPSGTHTWWSVTAFKTVF